MFSERAFPLAELPSLPPAPLPPPFLAPTACPPSALGQRVCPKEVHPAVQAAAGQLWPERVKGHVCHGVCHAPHAGQQRALAHVVEARGLVLGAHRQVAQARRQRAADLDLGVLVAWEARWEGRWEARQEGSRERGGGGWSPSVRCWERGDVTCRYR